MSKPLKLGISACFFHADPKRAIFKGKTLVYLEQSLSHWVMSQGALAFLIPAPAPSGPVALSDLVSELDGLVLQGGSDLSPKSYGQEPLKPEWGGDWIRDQYEIALVREFMKAGKPVLGVCRGAQLLNVAFGGTLYQDIGTQMPAARQHRDWEPYDQLFHTIRLETGTALAQLYPRTAEAKVNSVHHQAIDRLGSDLVIEARSEEDGIIEAIRLKGPSYVCGVQWHPEFHDPKDRTLLDGTPLLQEFMNEARRRKASQENP